VPYLCLPIDGYGGTAQSLTASDMDHQVTTVAKTLLSSAALAPLYTVATPQNTSNLTTAPGHHNTSSSNSTTANSSAISLVSTSPLQSTDYASVQTLITNSMLSAGCSTLLINMAVVQSAITALAKTISTVAVSATDFSATLAHYPIQQALTMASTAFAVQANILPLLEAVTDITKDPAQLSSIINDPALLTSYVQAANISTAAVLSAVRVSYTSSALVPTVVQAAAYGAGPLQSCLVSTRGKQ
jgi:hypothetical protein